MAEELGEGGLPQHLTPRTLRLRWRRCPDHMLAGVACASEQKWPQTHIGWDGEAYAPLRPAVQAEVRAVYRAVPATEGEPVSRLEDGASRNSWVRFTARVSGCRGRRKAAGHALKHAPAAAGRPVGHQGGAASRVPFSRPARSSLGPRASSRWHPKQPCTWLERSRGV